MKSEMPPWLINPLKLTLSEIHNPDLVLKDFFEKYDLPLFRLQLNEWLKQAPEFIYFSEDIEKLVEACWVKLFPFKEQTES